jgi:hypothetical protein
MSRPITTSPTMSKLNLSNLVYDAETISKNRRFFIPQLFVA